MPRALLEKMYDAGRYMFISSSGELPPNLQGIWTGTWSPAWSGDFTLDANIQCAVAAGFSANMPELMQGYFRMIESFLPDCRENARKIYGCRGILTNTRASNNCLLLHWGGWPGQFWMSGAGWLAHWFYDYYLYTGDRDFLARRTVPLLKEIALFYEDMLFVDAGGRYRFSPSYSPETLTADNATMDVAVAREVLGNLIAACETLKIEPENQRQVAGHAGQAARRIASTRRVGWRNSPRPARRRTIAIATIRTSIRCFRATSSRPRPRPRCGTRRKWRC